MSIVSAIRKAIDKKNAGGWEKWPQLYWAIDLHGTVIVPTYNTDCTVEFYPNAQNVLKQLTLRSDMMLILWTGTHKDHIDKYIEQMKLVGIKFDAINENPKCEEDELRNISQKIYFDILLDDKAGFAPSVEWFTVEEELRKYNLYYT